MKKLLALVMCFMLLGVSGAIAENTDVGTWYLSAIDYTEMDYRNMSFSLEEDGSAVLTMDDDTMSMNWTATDAGIRLSNETQSMELIRQEDGSLAVNADGTRYTFRRSDGFESEEAENADPDVELFEMIGGWKSQSVVVFGTEYSAADYQVDIRLFITDGEAILETNGEQLLFDAYLENGTLYIGDDEDRIECTLRTDDTLAFDLEEEGVVMTIVMVRDEEA